MTLQGQGEERLPHQCVLGLHVASSVEHVDGGLAQRQLLALSQLPLEVAHQMASKACLLLYINSIGSWDFKLPTL